MGGRHCRGMEVGLAAAAEGIQPVGRWQAAQGGQRPNEPVIGGNRQGQAGKGMGRKGLIACKGSAITYVPLGGSRGEACMTTQDAGTRLVLCKSFAR